MIDTILEANKIAIEQKATRKRTDSNLFNIHVTCMDGRINIDNNFDINNAHFKYDTIWLGTPGCKLILGKPNNQDIENYFAKYFRSAEVRNQVINFNLESHSHAPGYPDTGCEIHGSDTKAALKTTYDLAKKLASIFPQANIYRTHRYTNSEEGKIVLASILPEGSELPEDQKRFNMPKFEEKLLNNAIGIERDNQVEKVLSFTNVPLAFPNIGYSSLKCSYPIVCEKLSDLIGLGLGSIFTHELKDYPKRSLSAILHFDSAYGTYNHSSFEEARLALEEVKNLLKSETIKIKNVPKETLKNLIENGYVQLLWTVTSDATLETQKVIV